MFPLVIDINTSAGAGISTCAGARAGTGAGAGVDIGSGAGAGAGVDIGSGADAGVDIGSGAGAGVGIAAGPGIIRMHKYRNVLVAHGFSGLHLDGPPQLHHASFTYVVGCGTVVQPNINTCKKSASLCFIGALLINTKHCNAV